jgi:hypothetical protein
MWHQMTCHTCILREFTIKRKRQHKLVQFMFQNHDLRSLISYCLFIIFSFIFTFSVLCVSDFFFAFVWFFTTSLFIFFSPLFYLYS